MTWLNEANDQDQPVGAIDLPCEKPPTPTRLDLFVSPFVPVQGDEMSGCSNAKGIVYCFEMRRRSKETPGHPAYCERSVLTDPEQG